MRARKVSVAVKTPNQDGRRQLYLRYTNAEGKPSVKMLGTYLTGELTAKGQPRTKADKETYSKAMQAAAELQAVLNDTESAKQVQAVAAAYLAAEQSNLRAAKSNAKSNAVERAVNLFTQIVGNVKVDSITPTHVTNYIAGLASNGIGAKSTALYMVYFFAVCKYATKIGYTTADHVLKLQETAKEQQPKAEAAERDTLTADEVKRLFATPYPKGGEVECTAFVFSVLTGLRYSDIRQASKCKVEGCILRLTTQKTHTAVNVPLSDTAQRLLAQYGKKWAKLPTITAKALYHLNRWLESAKIGQYDTETANPKHVSFHTARHTAATLLLQANNGNIVQVQKLLGHKNVKTTQIYADIIASEQEQAVKQMNANLGL